MEIIYEDNHLVAVNKTGYEIVQGDRTGDVPLSESLKVYLKEKYAKPGHVFIGVIHRLDRPVTGAVVFARTSKALQRMNEKFRLGEVKKLYWAIVKNPPPEREGELVHWLVRNEQQNKSYAHDVETPDARKAILRYRQIAASEHYYLLEIDLKTGRHHQIRCQLAKIGCPVKGDLKYGADRSNPGGGISLHARRISFVHPVTRQPLCLTAPVPEDRLWKALAASLPAEDTPVNPDGTPLPEES
ncbi:MAG: RluA family pseudouridine synthase [Tannerella sp.]|jgi:23S rRNA pseudouridine1911/1915/1917 synthase|nr:RluA family pseudouridine synthase [Tannerella sp.]